MDIICYTQYIVLNSGKKQLRVFESPGSVLFQIQVKIRHGRVQGCLVVSRVLNYSLLEKHNNKVIQSCRPFHPICHT